MTTTEEVIRLAREAGFVLRNGYVYPPRGALDQMLKRLIDLVRAEENEACAKVCSEYADKKWRAYKGVEGDASERASDFVQGESSGSEDCAEAIRARRK